MGAVSLKKKKTTTNTKTEKKRKERKQEKKKRISPKHPHTKTAIQTTATPIYNKRIHMFNLPVAFSVLDYTGDELGLLHVGEEVKRDPNGTSMAFSMMFSFRERR